MRNSVMFEHPGRRLQSKTIPTMHKIRGVNIGIPLFGKTRMKIRKGMTGWHFHLQNIPQNSSKQKGLKKRQAGLKRVAKRSNSEPALRASEAHRAAVTEASAER
jgi:hypothetical protein